MKEDLADKLAQLPKKPGVYVFKDSKGLILYVGKAINLRSRVSSYFKTLDDGRGARIRHMVALVSDLDYTVTDNELESLLLEKNFIKQLKPKYNVDLRDDKNYLFIKINAKDQIPTVSYERTPADKNSRYFGPYTSSAAIKDTLRLVRKIFPYCAGQKITSKPCFYYHIGKCPGVCFGKISPEDYKNNYIKNIISFLDGRQTEILKNLQRQMKLLAASKKFEKAAKIRDQIFALNRVLERQKLIYPKKIDQDVFSLHSENVAVVNLFKIREGKLIQKENFVLDNAKNALPGEILQAFLERYYLETSSIPDEILLPAEIDSRVLQPVFAGKKTPRLSVPIKGQKFKLIQMGSENAKQYLESTTDKNLLEEARLLASLKELQRVLKLPSIPGRIEAYDISNIQGTNPVGSMIVFDFARPKKEDYRKFKINIKQTPDDFAMMREMLERRLKHSLPSALSPHHSLWPLPDLILIDGGKGQLNAATSVFKKSQIPDSKFQIPVIGLAKRLEEIFIPGKKLPLTLNQNSIALFLLQRIRDEAHRFAVKFHRSLRSKNSLSSVLDQIAGIGPAKKKALLLKFGSAAGIRKASLTEISGIVGTKLSEKIKAKI